MKERSRSSGISHVLFRKENGWTPSKAARWIEMHLDRNAPMTYEEIESEGGRNLKSGTYIVYRVGRGNFTSFGYGPELEGFPGVFFKFGGFRK